MFGCFLKYLCRSLFTHLYCMVLLKHAHTQTTGTFTNVSTSDSDVRSKTYSLRGYSDTDVSRDVYSSKTNGVINHADRMLLHAKIDMLRKRITEQTENLVKQGALVKLLSHYGSSGKERSKPPKKTTQMKITDKLNHLKKQIETDEIQLTDSDEELKSNNTKPQQLSKMAPIANDGSSRSDEYTKAESQKTKSDVKSEYQKAKDIQDLIMSSKKDIQQLINNSKTDIQIMINNSKAEIQSLISTKNQTKDHHGDRFSGELDKYATEIGATQSQAGTTRSQDGTAQGQARTTQAEEVAAGSQAQATESQVEGMQGQSEEIQSQGVDIDSQAEATLSQLEEMQSQATKKHNTPANDTVFGDKDIVLQSQATKKHNTVVNNTVFGVDGDYRKDTLLRHRIPSKTPAKEKTAHKADIVVSRDDLARLLAGSTNTSADKLIEFARKILLQTNINDVMVKKIENSTRKLEKIQNQTKKLNVKERETQKQDQKALQENLEKIEKIVPKLPEEEADERNNATSNATEEYVYDEKEKSEKGTSAQQIGAEAEEKKNNTLKVSTDEDEMPAKPSQVIEEKPEEKENTTSDSSPEQKEHVEATKPLKFDPLQFLLSHGELVNHTRPEVSVPKQAHFVRILSKAGQSMNISSVPNGYTAESFHRHLGQWGESGVFHRQLERMLENETQVMFHRSKFSHLLSQTQNVEEDADRLLTDMEDRILKTLPNVLVDDIKLDQETNTSITVPENTKERFDVTEVEVNQAAHIAGYLFNGDLRLLKAQEEGMTSNFNDNFHYKYNYDYEVNGNVKFWSGGVIPFTFHPHFTVRGRQVVRDAIAEFKEKTCISFVPRRNESNYIMFFHGRGCWSWLGFTGTGEQRVSLQRGSCLTKGNVLHQLMHVLGCGHEHVRSDRDEYINIQWENIRSGFKSNFHIQNNYKLSKKYDYLSVTHYPQSAFAKHQYDYTITVKGKSTKIGQRRQLSELDARSLNNIYCDDTNSIKKSSKGHSL